jgi:hypothetical protein
MDVQGRLDATDVARTFRILRKLEPDLVRELRTELQGELKPLAKSIAAKYPTQPPNKLYGFNQTYGRWGWDKVTGTVKITPGKTRKGAGRNNLVSLSMNYKSATPFVLDMIGRKNPGISPQGKKLYETVNKLYPAWPNGGRIFYKPFKAARKNIEGHTERIINRWSDKVSKELD